MSRISLSILVNVVLLSAVFVLGWKLYGREIHVEDAHVSSRPVTQQSALAASTPDSGAMSAISARLALIDTRLSAIELGQESGRPATQTQAVANKTISPQAAALANERLAAIVSGKEFDQHAMVGFNIALAKLPEDEQIALAVALSQAINQGRVRLKK